MPVYNGAQHIQKAIDSLYRQSFRGFELVVVDDGSTDETPGILARMHNPSLRVIAQPRNCGVAAALNRGLEACSGDLILRMDADDICRPGRLERQAKFMVDHPEISICGGWFLQHDSAGRSFAMKYPFGVDTVRAFLLFDNPLAHPCVCMRRQRLREHNLWYDESVPAAQDVELWSRCAPVLKMDNIPAVLVEKWDLASSVTRRLGVDSDRQAREVLRRELEQFGMDFTALDLDFHRKIGHGSGVKSWEELLRAESWLLAILEYNQKVGFFSDHGLRGAVAFVWLKLSANSAWLGQRVWTQYINSSLRWRRLWTAKEEAALFLNVWRRAITGHPSAPTGRLAIWDPH